MKTIRFGFVAAVILMIGVVVKSQQQSLPSFTQLKIDAKTSVAELLLALGDEKPLHYTSQRNDTALIRQGREIIINGRTLGPNGEMSSRQSKYFNCVHCHNVEIEDPNLRISDPDARLEMAKSKNLPFLQGTTLYGIVNREHWYNYDYLKKYGSLVEPANDTLVNAIHLCAVECSQGRPLEKWELEAVMAYLYSIEFKVGDLQMNESVLTMLQSGLNAGGVHPDLITLVKSHYFLESPATFVKPPKPNARLLGKNGRPENGRLIYEHSCLHCHHNEGVTNYTLSYSKLDFKHLRKFAARDMHYSVYNISRIGTYALPGYKPYMPNYTKERMSDQQLEDLMAFINVEASK